LPIILLRDLSGNSRFRLYLILTFVSLTLFFYSVSQIAYVIAEPSDLFGLASHFTPAYWIGLALLVLCSILVFLDKEVESDFLNLFVLLSLGLFLFGIATLVQENVRHTTIYANLADIRTLLATGHTDIVGPHAMSYYRTWPAAHFLHASTLLVIDLDFKDWLRFAPFIWVVSFTLTTYAIGRRFGISRNMCFSLSILTLSSYWMFQSDLAQQGMAVLLLLLLLMLLAKHDPRSTVAETILATLLFSTLVFTHGLTSLGLLLAVVVLSIYKKGRGEVTPLALLFFIIWLTWYMNQAITALALGSARWLSAPWDYIFRMGTNVEGLWAPTHTGTSALITQYSQLAYIFIFGILVLAAVINLFWGRVKLEHRPWLMVLLVWVAGLALSGLVFPNREMYIRLYVLGLVPVVSIILLAFYNRRLLVPLMLLCTLLFLPARYGTEGLYGQTFSSELAGARFVGQYISPVLSRPIYRPIKPWLLYRTGDLGVIPFYNTQIIQYIVQYPPPFLTEKSPELLDGASYVLNSYHGGISDIEVNTWMELGRGEDAILVYSNGSFRIYKNEW